MPRPSRRSPSTTRTTAPTMFDLNAAQQRISSSESPNGAMPEVSVCIPAYRQPEFLYRAVQSVLMQDFDDFEIVITDDSPDSDVMDVVKAIRDSRIRYSRNSTRLGSPANWVAALTCSSGRLIKFMHHDDCFARPDSLGRFVRML